MKAENKAFTGTFAEALDKVKKSNLNGIKAKEKYKIVKYVKAIEEKFALFEETRLKLVREFGTPDKKNPDKVMLEGSALTKFSKEFESLIEEEFEIEGDKIKLPESLLEELSIDHIIKLEPFFNCEV